MTASMLVTGLEPHRPVDAGTRREAAYLLCLVLGDAPDEVVGDPDIEWAVVAHLVVRASTKVEQGAIYGIVRVNTSPIASRSMRGFGFSAFLKLINLNQRPQRTEIRKKLHPSGSGYDFHKQTRGLSHRLLDGADLNQLLAEAEAITGLPERASAKAALQRLWLWRSSEGGTLFSLGTATYESPSGIFKVVFTPDVGLEIGGEMVAIHLWNTKSPRLEPRLVRAALALFSNAYGTGQPDDLAVLDLQTMSLIRMADPTRHHELSGRLITHLEDVFLDIREGDGGPRPEDRPALQ
jgi:hypothetical protein